MKAKSLLNSILDKLEKIEENQQGQLQGGFASIQSFSFSVNELADNKRCPTNNCQGGNCVEGCGGNHIPGCGKS